MSEFKEIHDATADALYQLEEHDFGADPIIYIHPTTWQDVLTSPEAPFSMGVQRSFMGCAVIANSNLPEDVVMAVDLEHAPYSNNAVAFGRVDTDE